MLRFLKGFFSKPTPPEVKAPYKTEMPATPAPAKCGCGRSQSGLCVGLHKLTAEEWAKHESNPDATKPAPVVKEPTPAKKAPVKKAPVKKPAAMKAPAKPKTPSKPKAAK